MIEEQTILNAQLPSTARILKATLIALAVALVILVTTILPAEFDVHPVGTAKPLGLTQHSQAQTKYATSSAIPGTTAPVQSGTVTPQPRIYKVDSEDFLVRPGQGFEMKYYMPKGAVMVYSWKADGKLFYELHGEPEQEPKSDV